MTFEIEKHISNFIKNQFPGFYHQEGENFILFTKAYYEWMQESGNPIHESRSLLEYRDIDTTTQQFLEYFQQKYLYGIPFNVVADKKLLLKHILDVYRSKGSIQSYKLLFRLIYNEEVDVYLPSVDILRVSDGTWVEPRYLEVNDSGNLDSYIGKKVYGISSNTSAVVESFIQEPINQNIISTLYISNIHPKGGVFVQGEKIVPELLLGNSNAVAAAPTVTGSLDSLVILNGGQEFQVGNIIKIAHRSIANNSVISYGVEGLLKVTEVSRGLGQINFNIDSSGFGYKTDAVVKIYNAPGDTGSGADFDIGSIIYSKSISYNTDLIVDYYSLPINSAAYAFPANTTANSASTIQSAFSYSNALFGSIASLTNIVTGTNYTNAVNAFVRSTQLSKKLPGTVSYNTSSSNVTFTGANLSCFSSNDYIYLQANSALSTSIEYQVIRAVTNSTSIELYGPPISNSTSSSSYRLAPAILPSNYSVYDPIMYRSDGTFNGLNAIISGNPSYGNNIIAKVTALNSGKGYVDGEIVRAYLFGGVNTSMTIVTGGLNYTNNEPIIFAGGGTSTPAKGVILTNSNGTITGTSITYAGSGYTSLPSIKVASANGYGAILTTSLTEFNTFSQVVGKVVKAGVGKKQGYWTTTRGFLNSDKYIQDSYFYQDYSYQLNVAVELTKYADIIKSIFHPSGSELFGKYQLNRVEQSIGTVLYEQTAAVLDPQIYIMSDSTEFTSDSSKYTVDLITENNFTADLNYIFSDATWLTADLKSL